MPNNEIKVTVNIPKRPKIADPVAFVKAAGLVALTPYQWKLISDLKTRPTHSAAAQFARELCERRIAECAAIVPDALSVADCARLSVGKTGLQAAEIHRLRTLIIFDEVAEMPSGVIIDPARWRALRRALAKGKAKRRAHARARSRGFVAHGRHAK